MYKVFLAEDEIVVREGIRNSIQWDKTSYVLTGEAPDGEMALQMILSDTPDILITDIRMPFMDGLALSQAVKDKFPRVKIIILSGHDEFEYAREAIQIGVEEYLLKPVTAKDILKTLDKMAVLIDRDKDEALGLETLKTRVQSYSEALKILNDELLRGGTQNAGSGFFSLEGKHVDPASLLKIDSSVLIAKLKYVTKKDVESIVQEYTDLAGNGWDEFNRPDGNPLPVYFLFGEIIVAVSKIVESMGGHINEIVPFSLNSETIRSIISSPVTFSEKVQSLLLALIEFRDSHSAGRYRSVIVKAREYIDSNFTSSDISLHSAAVHIGISPNYLSSIFIRETGQNFIEYLTGLRIERAKLLLKSTSMKNADIALETGFTDPHYFSYNFKKKTGFSPKEYRIKEKKR